MPALSLQCFMQTFIQTQNNIIRIYLNNSKVGKTCPSRPWRALNPCSGSLELPRTNLRIFLLLSLSDSSTAFQNHLATSESAVQCFNFVCFFQSATSMLLRPPIICCNENDEAFVNFKWVITIVLATFALNWQNLQNPWDCKPFLIILQA